MLTLGEQDTCSSCSQGASASEETHRLAPRPILKVKRLSLVVWRHINVDDVVVRHIRVDERRRVPLDVPHCADRVWRVKELVLAMHCPVCAVDVVHMQAAPLLRQA